MVWEQGVNLIVSLTAEVERGQAKCHPYWETGDYGPLKVRCLSQQYIYTNSLDRQPVEPPRLSAPKGPSSGAQNAFMLEPVDDPFIVVRHFTVTHSSYPFEPPREFVQLQYPHWPDFGTTSQPSQLLKLIEQCNKVKIATSSAPFDEREPEPESQRPVVVHCSAGCGRTGTFCTVDSVLDMLKRQRSEGAINLKAPVERRPSGNGWIFDQELDLVAKTVEDLRTQRPSMVQNLSQFVLCYESILEWAVSQANEP